MIKLSAFRWVPPFAQGFVRDLRVRWALEEAGIPYEEMLIGPDEQASSAYRALQPFGQVPAIEDGDFKLFESGAIVLHVAEQSERLMPPDPTARSRVTAWVFAALNTIEPPLEALGEIDLFDSHKPGAQERRATLVDLIGKRLAALEDWLENRDYLEDRFTAADLMMVAVLGLLRNTDVLTSRPRLQAYGRQCESRPAYVRAMADHLRPFRAYEALQRSVDRAVNKA